MSLYFESARISLPTEQELAKASNPPPKGSPATTAKGESAEVAEKAEDAEKAGVASQELKPETESERPDLNWRMHAPQPLVKAIAAWETNYPDRDITDRNHFFATLASDRANFPLELQPTQRAEITALTNAGERLFQAAVMARAEAEGIPAYYEEGDTAFRLNGFEDNRPVYVQTLNVNSAITTNAHRVRRNTAVDPIHGNDTDGSGIIVTFNDTDEILPHPEFVRPGGSNPLSKRCSMSNWPAGMFKSTKPP